MESILAVKSKDESSLPPLMFVHGAWHGAWCWKPLMDYLAEKGFDSYALDLPGHGTRKSECVVGHGIMDYVAEVESVINKLNIVKPILIGHSMGGIIVQKFLEKNEAQSSVLIAPCPAMGGSLWLPIKYSLHQPIDAIMATLGNKTAISSQKMCRRLFFDNISSEELEAHFEMLCLESSKAIRQMVLPGFKLRASKITSIPVAVAAAGKDYFFEFERLQNWAEEYEYDFLPFPEAAHNLLSKPEKFGFGKAICKWLKKTITTN
ncbi:alpha/beta hydrolase [Desulfonema ishimotonii]|uniref:Alpha/beta hydrolase n=1 Tax=Desulfonema ishimotonii TaxID=45657 RepID=A0A401FR29_9BACT|nr:alpha/beta hydrolase [Desulfonema ishimotonii]GBC59419.1 alpha/beta hydrolase [Desulfonema ishimotonii]